VSLDTSHSGMKNDKSHSFCPCLFVPFVLESMSLLLDFTTNFSTSEQLGLGVSAIVILFVAEFSASFLDLANDDTCCASSADSDSDDEKKTNDNNNNDTTTTTTTTAVSVSADNNALPSIDEDSHTALLAAQCCFCCCLMPWLLALLLVMQANHEEGDSYAATLVVSFIMTFLLMGIIYGCVIGLMGNSSNEPPKPVSRVDKFTAGFLFFFRLNNYRVFVGGQEIKMPKV
jgi:hypothetical protein